MKAFKYEVSVVEGALAISHGWSEKIKEIWVPDFNIVFNEKYGAFMSKTPRNKVYPNGSFNVITDKLEDSSMEEVDLNIDDVRTISTFVQSNEYAKQAMKKIFNVEDAAAAEGT